MHRKKRVLFVLKNREAGPYGSWNHMAKGQKLSSGLHNSVRFMVEMLTDMGVECKMVSVEDNNKIDREVHLYKPTHCIIEAFWVVPEKFDVLMRLHPKVKWFIRDHSKTEFLAFEGMAFGWTIDYLRKGVGIGANSIEGYDDMRKLAEVSGVCPSRVAYLPNYYPLPERKWGEGWLYNREKHVRHRHIDIGCFGAIRPLKNHVNQALAALDFADKVHGKLHFHVNASRVEGKADPILNNLRGIFSRMEKHKLIEHEWMEHSDFLEVVKRMEIVSQVSFSETFNIVSADAVKQGVVVIGSDQIPWLPAVNQADPNCVEDISRHYQEVWNKLPNANYVQLQRKSLEHYNIRTRNAWLTFLTNT